jgi:integrase
MLIFYLIGINISDLCNLKAISNNGRIEYRRAKTGRLYSIKVEPEAMQIIEKYKGVNFLLDILDRYKNVGDYMRRLNRALKEIYPQNQEISSYWARHTWATIASELEIPKETIGAALGHSDKSVTNIYINFNTKKIDDANRKVIDYLNNYKNTEQ